MPLMRTGGSLRSVDAQLELRESTDVGSTGMVDADDWLWAQLGINPRNLKDYTQDRILEAVYDLYKVNALASRVTRLNRDFIVGDGIRYSCANPNIEDIVGEFWHDDVNDLDTRLHDFALELGLYGEQCWEVFTGNVSGIVQLGYIDPTQIRKVTTLDDGEMRNPLVRDKVWIKVKGQGNRLFPKEIVRARNGVLAGDVFYLKVNSPSNATRGWPDLLHVADFLTGYELMMWDILERSQLMRAFIWDVTMTGASDPEVAAFAKRNSKAPKSGSVRVHNDKVSWQAVSPQLGSYESAKDADVLKEHIGGGVGLPKHWLSSAENVNRATAREMGSPTERQLATRQRYFVTAGLQRLIRFVLDKADEAGRIKDKVDGKVPVYDEDGQPMKDRAGEPVYRAPHELVNINAPEINQRDQVALGAMFLQICQGLAVAETQGWVPGKITKQVMASTLAQLGVDYDPSIDDEDEQDQGSEVSGRQPGTVTDLQQAAREMLRRGATAKARAATGGEGDSIPGDSK